MADATGNDTRHRDQVEAALRDSEARFRALLEGAPDAIVGVDRAGNICVVNAATERLFGHARDELLGLPMEALVPERHRQKHVALRDAYARAPMTRPMAGGQNLLARRKDGSEFEVEISLSPIETKGGQLVLSVVRDVSARKAVERRESTMVRALATIGESAAVLAHEIKNPLTAVNMALKAVGSRLGIEDRHVLDDLVDRLRRVEAMIRRTLSFAKPLDLRRSPCPVAALFDQAIADVRSLLAGRDIRFERDLSPAGLTVDVDGALMREVVANLLSNAIECSDGAVNIRLTAARLPDGSVVLTVEDDGPGLAPSARASIFRPFVTTKKQGTGLGLSICRKIVEEHGGRAEIEDVVPHGVRARIVVPGSSPPV